MKTRIKAEMWDKMQFLFRNYYDRMIHLAFYYDGVVDVDSFKKAVDDAFNQVPILHSAFVNNFIRPYWVVKDYSIDEIVEVVDSRDCENELLRFLTSVISVKSNVQMKIKIIRSERRTTIGLLVNHMCMDGGDAKKLLKTIVYNSNAYSLNEPRLPYRSGRRDYEQVYDSFDEPTRKKATRLYKNVSQVKSKVRFPLSKKSKYEQNQINFLRLPAETVSRFKTLGKENGATLNDLFLTAYIWCLYKSRVPKNVPISIPCMVDLRRHIPERGENGGYCNHTGFMITTVPYCGKNFDETLELVKKSTSENKNDEFLGLYSLPLLRLGYALFPHFLSEIVIRLGYSNPLMGMSNVGELKSSDYTFVNTRLVDAFVTGATKYKPFMQLATTSCNGAVTMTVAIRGNDEDQRRVNEFLSDIETTVNEYITRICR